MVGTLYGLGLSQQHGLDGKPLIGCKLYIYAGGTTTPADAYEDTALSRLHPWPMVADSNGRLPSFWLADGTYRARLANSAGIEQFDEDYILAIGASSGSGSGSSVDATAIFQTGDFLWGAVAGTRTGWVRANGRTIGSATSGATEYANAAAEVLYLHLWNTYSDTRCPVAGGRGANAAADWAANKAIGTIDMRGKGAFGLDDMGNSAASSYTGVSFSLGNATNAASAFGSATHTLTKAQLPDLPITVAWSDFVYERYTSPLTNPTQGDGAAVPNVWSGVTNTVIEDVSITASISGLNGTAHPTISPGRTGTWYIKL